MSVGQSKGIRARQGKANRIIDETNRLVSEYLTPHTTYFRFDAPKEPYIVSEAVRAMLKKQLPEDDVVSCTYTQTVQLAEPNESTISSEDLARLMSEMAKQLDDNFMRALMGDPPQIIRTEPMPVTKFWNT